MPFNHDAWNKHFLAHPGNEAEKYGITIAPARPQLGQAFWRCIGIHHLIGSENAGNHHVYLDVLDEHGERINGARLMVSNSGKVPYMVLIDKPANEAGANIPMYWQDTLAIYLGGDIPSDRAMGFHVRHEDEEPGTTRGHHSFYVVWQRQTVRETEPPPEPEPEPPAENWRDQLTEKEKLLLDNIELVPGLVRKMEGLLDGKA